jgi:Undecaprenyl-phosphate galactose phosphotransferase WbaP
MSAAAALSPSFSSAALPTLSYKRWATLGSIVLSDFLAIALSAAAAVLVRSVFSATFVPADYLHFTPAIALFFAVFALSGLYPGIASNPIEEFRGIMGATGLTYLLIIGATFLEKESASFSRAVFLIAWLLTIALVIIGRAVTRSWCASKSWWGVPTVILGGGRTGVEMLHNLHNNPSLGLRPICLLDNTRFHLPESIQHHPHIVTGTLSLAPVFARRYRDCYAIVAMPDLSCQELAGIVSDYAEDFPHVFVIPNLLGLSSLWVCARNIGGTLGLEVRQTLTHRLPLFIKRCCDLAGGAAVGLLAVPIVGAVWFAIRLTSPGPLFYGQRRIGRNDQPFTAWKFRTMVHNAAQVLDHHLAADPLLRAEWDRDHKLKNDPRVTPVGRFLRKTSLDELPQIWNVLQGQMSLVGPRPIVTAEIAKYGKRFDLYCKVPPGITGLWQVSGRNNTTYEARTEFDEYYVRNWSVSLDLYILFRTIKTVLFTEGAY